MRLGTETGSVINHLDSRTKGPEPTIGMGATILGWTDRHPATVTAWDGKILTIQGDNYKRTDNYGMSEHQEYTYTPNPEGTLHYYKRDRQGLWQEVAKSEETGRWKQTRGAGLRLGARERYYDFSF